MTEQNGQTGGLWTEEEAEAFAEKLVTFGTALPPRERKTYAAMLTMVINQDGANRNDAQGYIWQHILGGAIVVVADKMGFFDSIDFNAMAEQVRSG